MSSGAPPWLTVIAWIWLALAFTSFGVISFDIIVHQAAAVPAMAMAVASAERGRPRRSDRDNHHDPVHIAYSGGPRDSGRDLGGKPRWVTIAIEVSHCGAGWTLGDLIAEWTIYALALTVAGHALFAE